MGQAVKKSKRTTTAVAVVAATLVGATAVAGAGVIQPDWRVVAYAIVHQPEFEKIAKDLKSPEVCPDLKRLEMRLVGYIDEIRRKGHIATLLIERDDLFLAIQSKPEEQPKQVLFVRVPFETNVLFESLVSRFDLIPLTVGGARQITVVPGVV